MPAEDLEFFEVIGEMLVSMGRTGRELQAKGPVSLKIDGHDVTISPLKPKFDPNDKDLFSQRTTIYDAAQKVYAEQLGEQEVPVPILCHQQHMKPVGVCRACLVEVTATDRNGNKRTSLAPACYLPVAGGMEVSTLKSSERVAKIVRTVVELLQSDYQRPSLADGRTMPENELDRIGRMIQARENHYPRTAPDRGEDESSPIIQVDHNACILCDRCVRACSEIRSNFVIGRMGKGYQTRIAFDDDLPMGESSCVACGECMISCPTGALTNRQVINIVMDRTPEREIEIELPADDPGVLSETAAEKIQ